MPSSSSSLQHRVRLLARDRLTFSFGDTHATSTRTTTPHRGAVEARLAHNQKVTGSKPVIANIILAVVAQSVERKTFNLVVVGSIPTDGRRIGDNHLK